MSMKGRIYAEYLNKVDAHNAAIGGEPVYGNPSREEIKAIESLPVTYGGPRSGKAYVQPDGRVTEIRATSSGFSYYSVTYQNETHFRGYRESMGMGMYFEG